MTARFDATVTDLAPIAEGAHDGMWLVAYAASCGGVDVLAHRFRRTSERRGDVTVTGVDLGACVWCGRVRDGRWSGVIGEPRASALASAWRWVEAR